MTLVLSEDDVNQVLTMGPCLEVIEHTFRDYGAGEAVSRPRTHAYTPYGEGRFYNFKSMDGAVPRYGVHALRISSEMVQETRQFGKLRGTKLPLARGKRYVGLVLLFDMETTEPLAIIQESGLQRMRVGATSGVAAKTLSRPDSERVGLFGTGFQAGPQLEALALVRPISEVVVYSPTPEHREQFAAEMSERLGLPVRPVSQPREVVRGVDILACATNSLEPVFDGSWLEPGQHVNSVQAGELDATTTGRAALVCVRSSEVSRHYFPESSKPKPVQMSLAKKAEEGLEGKLVELGKVMCGKQSGRTDQEQITLFGGSGTGPSSGLGIQFASAGKLVYDEAKKRGLGWEIPTDYFLEYHHP